MTKSYSKYILITPAKNEDRYIERTIKAVIAQTILPQQWVIVSDGSTDNTDAIVEKYASLYPFIQLVRKAPKNRRVFSSKVEAIRLGFEHMKNDDYEFYGNLDADVSFPENYYETILQRFEANHTLGIAGGVIYDLHKSGFIRQKASLTSVGGPIQMFRKKCYVDIGGYQALEIGNVDGVAEVTARMKGWKVQSFEDIKVNHYRVTGSEGRNVFAARLREGRLEYMVGYHPLFHLARAAQRISERPFLVGSFLRSVSYFWTSLKAPQRPLSKSYITFLRKEEMTKLKETFGSALNFQKAFGKVR